MNFDEFKNESDKVSKIISKVHALKIEGIVQKNEKHLDNTVDYLYSEYMKQLSNFEKLKFDQEIDKRNFQDLTCFDYQETIDWVKMVERKLKSKLSFVHNDVSYSDSNF